MRSSPPLSSTCFFVSHVFVESCCRHAERNSFKTAHAFHLLLSLSLLPLRLMLLAAAIIALVVVAAALVRAIVAE